MEQLYEFIHRLTTFRWTHNFLVDLKRAYDPLGSYIKTGFGLNWQLIKAKREFKELDSGLMAHTYHNSKKRLFVIDSETVCPMLTQHDGSLKPHPDFVKAMTALSSDCRNIVIFVSETSKKTLYKWFSSAAPNLGLAVENGLFWRWDIRGHSNSWNKLLDLDDSLWVN